MVPVVVGVVIVVALMFAAPVALHALTHTVAIGDRTTSAREHLLRRVRRTHPEPVGRPIEDVVADVRRLGRRFHAPQTSHVKAEALRRAYDTALAEGCTALGIDHLLDVLEPGPERDAERRRVEQLLHRWGVDLGDLDAA